MNEEKGVKNNQSRVYKKLFGIYILMILVLIAALDFYFIKRELKITKENHLYINEKLLDTVDKEIDYINRSADELVKRLYSDHEVVKDVIVFLNNDTTTYLKSKLDKFSASSEQYYKGIEYFTSSAFTGNDALKYITYVSYERGEERKFDRMNRIATHLRNQLSSWNKYDFSDIMTQGETVSIIKEIRHPITFKPEGALILTYELKSIDNIMKNYEGPYETLILKKDGLVVYDSEKRYVDSIHPYAKSLLHGETEVLLDQWYMSYKRLNPLNLWIVTQIPKANVSHLSRSFYNILIALDIFLFILVETVLYFKLKRLTERTDAILVAMDSMKNGDLDARIELTKDNDEINYISERFNEMGEQLKSLIDRRYKAELEQKNAEMKALQSQINPHFLYNTLESIRMKAICNGDREVGKMLFTLAVLFRKQIKGGTFITVREELDYCEKYLEIFKIRYPNKFEFTKVCDDALLDREILKFTLQPLIENYFVHGIDLERSDNRLTLYILKREEHVEIVLEDNGKGMEDDVFERIKKALKTRSGGESIGLTNVNERLILAYGQEYGLYIERSPHGMLFKIKIP